MTITYTFEWWHLLFLLLVPVAYFAFICAVSRGLRW